MMPATAMSVSTYGSAWKRTAPDDEKAGRRCASGAGEAEQQRGRERAARAPVAEDDRRQRDEAAPRGHVLVERAHEADREVRPAHRRQDAGGHHGEVARARDRDADRLGRPRVLADRRRRSPCARAEEEDGQRHDPDQRHPGQQVRLADRVAHEPDVLDDRQRDVGDARDVVRRALVAVVVEEDVAGQSGGDEVQRDAADHLIGAQLDREEGVHEGQRAARDHAHEQAEEPRVEEVGAEDPEERPRQHHALEADVHDPAALGDDAAQRAEDQRCGIAQRGGDERRPGDDVLEVAHARLRRGHGAPGAHDAGHDRAPAQLALAAPDRPAAGHHGEQADDDRRRRRAHQRRRQRDEPRDDAQRDAGPAGVARIGRPRRGGGRHGGAHATSASLAGGAGAGGRAADEPARPDHHAQHDHVGADDEHDEALDDEGQVGGQLGLEDRRVQVALRGAAQAARRTAAPPPPCRWPCCARAGPRRSRRSRPARSGCRWWRRGTPSRGCPSSRRAPRRRRTRP